ncbi:MAG: hypothetical protein PHS92_04175 [Candidatus Gracilibacteria bacterium]|nr:hypothetical protein [Candidatus Gracilibacteria bacterium]
MPDTERNKIGLHLQPQNAIKDNDTLGERFSYDGEGLSETDEICLGKNHEIYEIELGEPIDGISRQKDDGYIRILKDAINSYLYNYRLLKTVYSNCPGTLKKEKENEFLGLIDRIGLINDHISLPSEKRILFSGTIEAIDKIRDEKGDLSLGTNSYFAAGSLDMFLRLMNKGVLSGKDIEIKLGNRVNLQENIGVIKLIENQGHDKTEKALMRFERGDILSKLHIHVDDNASIAHGANICSKFDKESQSYKADVHLRFGAFLGINCIVGSGSDLKENSVIWFGSKIGYNVKIGENTVIGKGSKIKDDVNIGKNCIVLDGAHISKGFKTVSFAEYMENEIHFDSKQVNSKKRRNFVIQLSAEKKERQKQLSELGSIYLAMSKFNKHNVTPENKTFAVIDSALLYLNESFPELGIIRHIRGRNARDEDDINALSGGFYGNKQINRDFEAYLQAYPKDKEKFIEDLGYIYEGILNGNANVETYIRSLLDFPAIESNPNITFLGKNSFVGNVHIGPSNKNLIMDTYIREDENATANISYHDNVQYIRCTLHGPGKKVITGCFAESVCFHGSIKAFDSSIGELRFPSIINNSTVLNSKISGRFNCNYGRVIGSEVSFDTTLSGQADKEIVLEESTVGEMVIIRPGNKFTDCIIGDNTFIGESPGSMIISRDGEYLEGKVMKKPKK